MFLDRRPRVINEARHVSCDMYVCSSSSRLTSLDPLSPNVRGVLGQTFKVPYFDFMSAVKGGILLDVCVPEAQRLAFGGRQNQHPLPIQNIPRIDL